MSKKKRDDDVPNPPGPDVNRVDIEDEDFQEFQIPKFVNHINTWWYGHDLYFDMALVAVEQMANIKPGATVKEAVYDRYVMSTSTFEHFFQRLNTLREQLKKAGLVNDADATKQSDSI